MTRQKTAVNSCNLAFVTLVVYLDVNSKHNPMKRFRKTRSKRFSSTPVDPQLPPVKLKTFISGHESFTAYQLADNQVLLSLNQIVPYPGRECQKEALSFINSNYLEKTLVTLPNKRQSTLYPLPTVTAFWSHLNSLGQLPEREKKLLALFLAEQPIQVLNAKEKIPILPPKKQLSFVHPQQLAKSFKIHLNQEIEITILAQNTNYYIDIFEGLTALGTQPTWLLNLSHSSRKNQALKRKGYSGRIYNLAYQDSDGIFEVSALKFSDWLVVWEYFGTKGNTKAIAILRSFAHISLHQRIKDACLVMVESNATSVGQKVLHLSHNSNTDNQLAQ